MNDNIDFISFNKSLMMLKKISCLVKATIDAELRANYYLICMRYFITSQTRFLWMQKTAISVITVSNKYRKYRRPC